ncbi:MAG: hypothetical protein VKI83_11030 [Synechococcaceae cyanobacterium]|nr:hypothetical protein [Synechococcaceae cyanobacterium]
MGCPQPADALAEHPPDRQRLRARLLEFLKFRVLAAQHEFFSDFPAGAEAQALRAWLEAVGWREALKLEDRDLLESLETARRLYLD